MNQEAKELYLKGWGKFQLEDYYGAISDFNDAIELDSTSAEIYIKRGLAKMQTQDSKQLYDAFGDYLNAAILEPENAEALNGLGILQMRFNPEDPQGLSNLEKAAKIDPSKTTYWNIGMANFNLGNYKAMHESFDNFIVFENPKDGLLGEAYYLKGLASFRLNDYHDAIKNFSLAIVNKANLNYHLAFFNRAISFNYINEPEKAIQDYTAVLTILPDDIESFIKRSELYYKTKNIEGALDDLRKVLTIDQNNIVALEKIGSYLLLNERYEEAINYYSQLIHLQANHSKHYQNRGTCYFGLRNYWAAITDYGNSIQVGNPHSSVFYYRGLCHYYLNNDQACADWQSAFNLGFTDAKTWIDKHCN